MKNYRISSVQIENLPMCLDTIHRAFKLNCDRFGFTKENYPTCAAQCGSTAELRAVCS